MNIKELSLEEKKEKLKQYAIDVFCGDALMPKHIGVNIAINQYPILSEGAFGGYSDIEKEHLQTIINNGNYIPVGTIIFQNKIK